jgi:cytochrome c oxidase assembly protein subunit 11
MPKVKPTSHRKIYIIGGIAAVIMFGFCFAMVPLYGLICKATGINTSAPNGDLLKPVAANTDAGTVDMSREVTIQFIAIDHMGLPWDFYPRTKMIRVHPGENAKVFFYAKNTTDNTMTVQAIPSLTPPESIGHFHKVECFCFRQQTLKGHEDKDMALIFNIDKDLPKQTHVITLAYTLFAVTPKESKKG